MEEESSVCECFYCRLVYSKRERGMNLMPLEERGAAGRKEKGFWIFNIWIKYCFFSDDFAIIFFIFNIRLTCIDLGVEVASERN